MKQSEIERDRRARRQQPLFEVIGDDHPDQPRFQGGPILVVVVVGLLWAVGGAILWAIW